jgi:hypothetical protein
MKKILMILVIAGSLAACNNNKPVVTTDARADSLQLELTKRHIIDSINTENAAKSSDGTAVTNTSKTVEHTTVVHQHDNAYSGKAPAVNTPVAEKKKKGWSATAKGAVIGAGVGGITGAMVDKKKGEGAIVGGLLGAGTGAGVGAIIDKSKKNKESKQNKD